MIGGGLVFAAGCVFTAIVASFQANRQQEMIDHLVVVIQGLRSQLAQAQRNDNRDEKGRYARADA